MSIWPTNPPRLTLLRSIQPLNRRYRPNRRHRFHRRHPPDPLHPLLRPSRPTTRRRPHMPRPSNRVAAADCGWVAACWSRCCSYAPGHSSCWTPTTRVGCFIAGHYPQYLKLSSGLLGLLPFVPDNLPAIASPTGRTHEPITQATTTPPRFSTCFPSGRAHVVAPRSLGIGRSTVDLSPGVGGHAPAV